MDASVVQLLMGQDALLLEAVFVDAHDVGQTAQEEQSARREVEVGLAGLELLEFPGLAEVDDEEVGLRYGV